MRVRSFSAFFITFIALAACATRPTPEEAELMSIAKAQEIAPATKAERAEVDNYDPLTQAAFWGTEYDKNPGDLEAATKFANVLRAIGSQQRAVEVASATLALHPENPELLSIMAKSMLENGDANGAANALSVAHRKDPLDTDIMNTLGVAYDQTGRHVAAQNIYKQALLIDPDKAALHSNLGLSYALTGKPDLAESHLKRAVDLPEAGTRERQNLVLVLSVLGKFDEAKLIASTDLPDARVEQNIAYFRSMLAPQRTWRGLRGSFQ